MVIFPILQQEAFDWWQRWDLLSDMTDPTSEPMFKLEILFWSTIPISLSLELVIYICVSDKIW